MPKIERKKLMHVLEAIRDELVDPTEELTEVMLDYVKYDAFIIENLDRLATIGAIALERLSLPRDISADDAIAALDTALNL